MLVFVVNGLSGVKVVDSKRDRKGENKKNVFVKVIFFNLWVWYSNKIIF